MSVLAEIVAGAREDAAMRERRVSIATLRRHIDAAPPPTDAYLALGGATSADVAVIAEVKRRSPSKGDLAAVPEPAVLAAAYAAGGASAVSVLTEGRRFGGSLDDLAAVRTTVSVPVLRKDFLVSEYQLVEARAFGADLILLIVASLTDTELGHLLRVTHDLGMRALVEVHDAEETTRAVDSGAQIIGVNARNLHTLDVDRDTFSQLAPLVPASCVLVAESGIRDAADVAAVARHGATAVLVGESVVTADDPEAAVSGLVAAGTGAVVRPTSTSEAPLAPPNERQ